jgi:hypothetical protein
MSAEDNLSQELFFNVHRGIHAQVPVSSVETDTAALKKAQVYGAQDDERDEKEVPVKKGSSVFVTGMTKRSPDRYRTRTYNPPREKKA